MVVMAVMVVTVARQRTVWLTVTEAMVATAVAAVAAVAPRVTISIQTKNGPVPVAQAEQAVRAEMASKVASLSITKEV
jgi:ABC-type taurine transport system substrate-binding protein